MKEKVYEYLISYHHKYGSGTSYMTRSEKIENIDDALAVSKEIERAAKVENVGIISFQLLCEHTK